MQAPKDQFDSLRKKAIIVTGVSMALYAVFMMLTGFEWNGFGNLCLWLAFLVSSYETRSAFAKHKALYIIVVVLTVLNTIELFIGGILMLKNAYVVSQLDNNVDPNGNPIIDESAQNAALGVIWFKFICLMANMAAIVTNTVYFSKIRSHSLISESLQEHLV